MSVSDCQIQYPEDHEETGEETHHGNSKTGNCPLLREVGVVELPQSEENKTNETEPYAFINCSESNPRVIDPLHNLLEGFPLVDVLAL